MMQSQRRDRNVLFRPFPGDETLNVSFDIVEEKNEVKTAEAGYAIFDNVEVITIRAPANKECTVTSPVDGLCNMDGEVVTYAERFPDDYERWKQGHGSAVSGMPLKQAPFMDKASVATLAAAGVYSVEQLADMGGQPLKTLGMQGRKWQQQAKAYLESAHGSKEVTALASENAELKARLEALEAMVSGRKIDEPAVAEEDDGDDEKEALKQALRDRGVTWRGNPSVETLQRMIAESE